MPQALTIVFRILCERRLLVPVLAGAVLPASASGGQVLYREDFEGTPGVLPRVERLGRSTTSIPNSDAALVRMIMTATSAALRSSIPRSRIMSSSALLRTARNTTDAP